MGSEMPKLALGVIRATGVSVRTAAREWGVTVDEIHNAANCLQKHACKGGGCRIR